MSSGIIVLHVRRMGLVNSLFLQNSAASLLTSFFFFFFFVESPKSYISEDGGSPCPVDPNTMDVDSMSAPPTMVNNQPGCRLFY